MSPGLFFDAHRKPAPAIVPCDADHYCPGNKIITHVPCPSGTSTFGAKGASAVEQCKPLTRGQGRRSNVTRPATATAAATTKPVASTTTTAKATTTTSSSG